MAQITTEPVEFTSSEGNALIKGVLWLDKDNASPKGIVQLVHGMAEHIKRYDAFARFLVGEGFVVCGHDQFGHGESVASHDDWGHLPLGQGENILVEDVHLLRGMMQERFGTNVPHFLFGHSMGSFVVRLYIARHGEGLSGAVVCGTGNVAPIMSKGGNMLAHLIAKKSGQTTRSAFLDNMGVGGYNKAIKDPRTPVDWLSYNEANVDAYVADEACGFMFTVGGYSAVTALTGLIVKPEVIAAIPKDLPVLFIAGQDDPVGDMGKGVQAAYNALVKAGLQSVGIRLYPHMRHEILNEDGAQEVMEDVAQWMEGQL